jgi:glycosyltransferase involved in cell wall biosynthesis
MYVPMCTSRPAADPNDFASPLVRIVHSQDFSEFDRFLYWTKLRRIKVALERQVALQNVGLVHSHYLFAAGGVAYHLAKEKGIRYVTAVRSSDINRFFRHALHLRAFGVRILEGASKVVFLSPAHQRVLLSEYVPERLRESILTKSMVIPNGISDFWAENECWRAGQGTHDPIRLLFVGEFTRNKNASAVIRAGETLAARGRSAEVTLVGDGPERVRLRTLAAKSDIPVRIHDWVTTKPKLLDRYREADIFVMPSVTETFGLAYVEAMSQGLPVIYSRNQGIDGYFRQGMVGYSCDPRDAGSIADAVCAIEADYTQISRNCTSSSGRFRWGDIASQYESLYAQVCQ